MSWERSRRPSRGASRPPAAPRSKTSRSSRASWAFLGEEQEAVSRRFAAAGRAKVEDFPFVEGKLGLPLVPGALAHLECRVRSFHDEGDHAVWVGEVRSLSAHPGRPLLYHSGSYRTLGAAPPSGKGGGDRL
jgi:flavin reductase (DIM6/NTAB) family NADH-FMN oxidoreductase RutF